MTAPAAPSRASSGPRTGLARQMGLAGLAATGICSMMGAGINVVPFVIQRNVEGIGPWVFAAYLFGAVPAVLAAFAYAILASAMPRAGGSYVYASRGLNPYLGFVASFSQWFGLCVAIGVISYVIVPFLRDVAVAVGADGAAARMDEGPVRLTLALTFLWTFVGVNLRGLRLYERTLVPLMVVMFALGAVVIVAGFAFDQADFAAALAARGEPPPPPAGDVPFRPGVFLAAAAVLFSSFIGFDSIAQAGGEARDPARALPRAIGIAVVTVGAFYMLFTAAVYHAVPWSWIAREAAVRDLTAPGMLGYLLPPGWTALIVAGAAVALINDLPAMLLAVSRLVFAWAEDGVFPRALARVHPVSRTPRRAILLSGATATMGVLGSHFAGDFFLGVDILVTALLVNFLLMCVTVLTLPWRSPELAARVRVVRSRRVQVPLAGAGVLFLGAFLVVQVRKDLGAEAEAWYYHSTWAWLVVMAAASAWYLLEVTRLRRAGVDVDARFRALPPE